MPGDLNQQKQILFPAGRDDFERGLRRALEITEGLADHPTLAVSYSNLALVEQDLGNLSAACRLMRKASDIYLSRDDHRMSKAAADWLQQNCPADPQT